MPTKTTTTPEKYLMTKNNENDTTGNGTVTPVYPRTSIDNIVKSTTDNTTLQSILDGKQSTITVNPSTTTATLAGLGIDGVNYAVGGGGIQTITSNALIIWNTDPGIYRLAPGTNGPMDIHWYGTDTTSSSRKLRVTRGVGEVYLYITNSRSNSTSADINFKSWYIIYMITNQSTGEMPNIAVGWTSASQGAILNYNLRNTMYMEPTTTGSKLVLTTTTSNKYTQSTWSTAGLLKTNTSGQVSVDTTSYGKKLYKYRVSLKNWYKDSSQDTLRHLMVEFVADISSLSGKSVVFNFYEAAYSGWNTSVSCTGVSFSNIRYYIQEDYSDGEGNSYSMTIPIGTINYGEDENEDSYDVMIYWYDLYYNVRNSLDLGLNISTITVTSLGSGTAIN